MSKTNAELTPDQIQRLYVFVENRHMYYKDLQHELVDHLASSIEELMSKDSTLNFEIALSMIYKRYPITGFYQFSKDKRNSLKYFWRKKFLSYLLRFFKLPMLLMSITAIYLIYHLLLLLAPFQWGGSIFIFGILFTILILIKVFKQRNNFENKRNKYLIIDSYFNSFEPLTYITSFVIVPLAQFTEYIPTSSIYFGIVFSGIYWLTIITYLAMGLVFPRYLEAEIKEKYAHLEIAKG